MNAQNINSEIITIGDEILIGQIIDSNSAWIAQQLNNIGVNVYQITSVSDNKQHIINSLNDATSHADLIIITGGLGPTKDDITKNAISEYFNSPLIRNQEVLEHIVKLLEPCGVKINELNIQQADVPDKCKVLYNALGTAPGMWLEKNGKVYVFMPGVPFEMKYIVTEQLIPRLKTFFNTPAIVHKTLMLQGIAESMLAQHIEPWESNLPQNIKLAYLPSPGIIRLRLTAKGDKREVLEKAIADQVNLLKPYIRNWYFADDDESIEVTIGKLLKNNNKTLSVAESCTGGKISQLITSVPGCSEYYLGGVIAYANQIKEGFLEVDPHLLINHGAVSQQVVEAMASNICRKMRTDYAIATSGIAGPDGGTPDKPVGTVWVAVASTSKVISKKFLFGDSNRERNIQRATLSALRELHKFILSEMSE